MADIQEMQRRQKALSSFGEFVLDTDDLQQVLQEACRLVAAALNADLAKVVEIDRKSNTGLVRAGIGWDAGVVGRERVDLGARTSEAFAIERGEPVITRDIAHEDRFEFPPFMKKHGVVAIINVPIFLPGRDPYGLLQVDAREPRDFGEDEVEFLKTYAMVLGPVIDRLQTVVELRETDERLHLIVENATDYVIIVSDAEDVITDWLGGSSTILGWSKEEVIGQTPDIIFTEEDRAAGIPEREREGARKGGAAPNVRWHLRKDGSRVFLDGQTVSLRAENGEHAGFLKIGQDVTDRKRNADRQAVLLAELQHRVRNVLAMVRSIVRRTVEGGASVAEVGEHLEGRIDALARTQALLTRTLGTGVDLEYLVREELLAQAAPEDQIAVAGPSIQLAPKAAEVLTLAVHELATNATKYGALSGSGQLSVTWRTEERDDSSWLHFSWIESGVDVASELPQRTGFGTELITRRVPYELEGRAEANLRPDGMHCVLEFPLIKGQSILETGGPP
jgi:PAS domain S-box-containing protein